MRHADLIQHTAGSQANAARFVRKQKPLHPQ